MAKTSFSESAGAYEEDGLARVRRGIRKLAPAWITVLIFSFFINLLLFVSPLYMLQIYDRVLSSRSIETLIALTVLAGVLILVYALMEMLRSRVFVRLGEEFDEALAAPVFDAVHKASVAQPGGAHVQCLRDADSVREFLTGSSLIAFCDAPWFPVFVVGSFILHPWFGYIALAGSIITLALTVLNEKLTKTKLMAATRAGNAAVQSAQAMMRNTEVIQAMGMLGALRRLWGTSHADMLTLQAQASDQSGLVVAGTKFFRVFLQTVILGTGAYLAIHRETSPGTMIAASILIGRAMQPIELVVGNWKNFVNVRGSYARLRAMFQLVGSVPGRMALPKPRGLIHVQDLYASPPGQKNIVLQAISFALQPGELLGVVGPSAAGKSSLARVLMGVWPVLRGAVRLDGNDLSHWNPQELGKHVGYLPQDVELFSGTIAENIARFQDVDADEVLRAAKLAGCHEIIQLMAEGYNTPIGEGGQALSGGQRQRIGLARALYGSPSFVVLDEPNANLDSAGEEALLEALKALRASGITVIIITHKLNVLAGVDKILILTNGQVQAFGKRDEVLGRLTAPRVVTAAAEVPAAPPTARQN